MLKYNVPSSIKVLINTISYSDKNVIARTLYTFI